MIKKLKDLTWPVAFHWFVLIPAGVFALSTSIWLLFAALAEIFMWL
jgi:hypothetical protein